MNDNRRALRKQAVHAIEVADTITGRTIGQVGNLSEDGMLLISQRALPVNALFQLSFNLPSAQGSNRQRIEIGVHEQWSEMGTVQGQFWTGFRIIDIGIEDLERLTTWVNAGQR